MKMISITLVSILLSLLSCKKVAEPETFLIPEGTDVIVLVFDYENGVPEEKDEEGRRIYRIPNNGIYYTQLPRVKGILDQQFYYVDSLGNKLSSTGFKHMLTEEYHNRLKEDEIYLLDEYDGGFINLPEEGIREGSTDDYPSINWIYATFGTSTADRLALRTKANAIVDSIQKYYPEKYDPLKEERAEITE